MEEIVETLEIAKKSTNQGKPIIILMRTIMGYGVDYMMDKHEWHGVPPNEEETDIALAQLEETLGDY